MRIAIFHELPYGGARRAALEFGRILSKNNDVDFYYIDEAAEEGLDKVAKNVRFIKFRTVKWEGNNWRAKLYKDTIELFRLSILHKQLAQELDKKHYDFVFVHGSRFTQAPFILRFLGTTSVYYCQEPLRMVYEPMFAIPKSLALIKKVYETINRVSRKIIDSKNIRSANILLANSKYTRNNIKKAYGIASTVLYLGVNTSIFYPEKNRKKYGLLFVGSKDKSEGLDFFKQILKKMKYKVTVKFHFREDEWITDAALRKLYSESKILIGLSYNEPFGLAPVEAQACATSVVAVSEGGYRETIVDGKTGLLIARDARKIAQALDRLLTNEGMLKKFSNNALNHAKENWSWEKSVDRLIKIFENQRN